MLTKDILRIKPKSQVTILDTLSGETRRRSDVQISDIEPRRTRIAVLEDISRYQHAGTHWYKDTSSFLKNPAGNSFLVSIIDGTGDKFYFTIKASAFIAVRADYDAYWQPVLAQRAIEQAEAERLAQIQREQYERRRAIQVSQLEAAKVQAESLSDSIKTSLESILGSASKYKTEVRVSPDGNWENEGTEYEVYRVSKFGTVTLDLKDALRLIELALAE